MTEPLLMCRCDQLEAQCNSRCTAALDTCNAPCPQPTKPGVGNDKCRQACDKTYKGCAMDCDKDRKACDKPKGRKLLAHV